MARRAMPRRFDVSTNELLDFRIGKRRAGAGLVAIKALPGLLAEAALLAELRRRSRRENRRPFACANRCRGRRDRSPRADPSESRSRPSPRRFLAAARLREEPARRRRSAGGACGCRRSRGSCRRRPATFPSLRASARSVASVSGEVSRPRTISTRRMMLAGEKKCMPATEAGRLVAEAIASMSR